MPLRALTLTVITFVLANVANGQGGIRSFTGRLDKIDPDKRLLFLWHSLGTGQGRDWEFNRALEVLEIDKNCRLILDGKRATLASIGKGYNITVTFVGKRAYYITACTPEYEGSQKPAREPDYGPSASSKTVLVQSNDPQVSKKPTDSDFPARNDKSAEDTLQVMSIGTGSTPDEALKDAFRKAIGQVLGELVDAETLIKGDRLIADKVLIYSKGFISDYQDVKEWRSDGLFHKKIIANVQRRQLAMKLSVSGVNPREFDGRRLYAKLVTELQERKEAQQVTRRLFDNFPTSLIRVTVASEPQVKEKSESEATLTYEVEVSVELARYDAFVRRITPVLDLVATRKGKFSLTGLPASQVLNEAFCKSFLPEEAMPSADMLKRSPLLRIVARGYSEPWWTKTFDAEKNMVLLINVARSKNNWDTDWIWYHVPLVDITSPSLRVEVRFLNEGQGLVKKEEFQLGPGLPSMNLSKRSIKDPRTGEVAQATQIIMSSFFVNGSFFKARILLARSLVVSLRELREIRSVRCFVLDDGAIELRKLLNRRDAPGGPKPPAQ